MEDEDIWECHKEVKKNGHTRRNIYYRYDNSEGEVGITRNKVNGASNGGNHSDLPVPMTAVDQYFDHGFCFCSTLQRGYQYQSSPSYRPLKTDLEQEAILTCLEKNAIHVKEYRRTHKQGSEIHYTLPIIGHCLITDEIDPAASQSSTLEYSTKKMKKQHKHHSKMRIRRDVKNNWLYFKGKFWDPSYLYTIHYHDHHHQKYDPQMSYNHLQEFEKLHGYPNVIIKPLCLLKSSPKYKEKTALGIVQADKTNLSSPYHENPRNRLLVKDCLNGTSKASSVGFEIDLGCYCELTHVGLLGIGGQHNRSGGQMFPPQYADDQGETLSEFVKDDYRHRLDRGKRHKKRRKSTSFILIVNDVYYLKEYHIEYRNMQSRQWMPYSSMSHILSGHAGQETIDEEVVHSISLQARYLRIIPIDWHGTQGEVRFTVLFYGHQLPSHLQQQQGKQRQQLLLSQQSVYMDKKSARARLSMLNKRQQTTKEDDDKKKQQDYFEFQETDDDEEDEEDEDVGHHNRRDDKHDGGGHNESTNLNLEDSITYIYHHGDHPHHASFQNKSYSVVDGRQNRTSSRWDNYANALERRRLKMMRLQEMGDELKRLKYYSSGRYYPDED